MNNTDKQKDKSRRSQIGFYEVIMICLVAIGATALAAHQSSLGRDTQNEIASDEQTLQAQTDKADNTPSPQLSESLPQQQDESSAGANENTTQKVSGDIRSAGSDTSTTEESVSASGTISAKKYTRPVSGEVITSHSGDELVYSATLDDWRIHSGTDYKATAGEAVRSIADGTVKKIFCDDMMGWCVAVAHDDSLMSYYYNLSPEISVKEGQNVKMGDTLGGVGESASAESAIEPHLHLEVTKSSKQIDPESLFN